MSAYKIVIPFTPKPKKSVSLNTKKGMWYNPGTKQAGKIKEHLRNNFAGPMLTGPLLVIEHHLIPVASYEKPYKRRAMHLLPNIKRPDGDNMEKFLSDACNGILWDDDAKIVWMLRSKSWTMFEEGATILFFKEIPYTTPDYDSLLTDIEENIYIPEEYARQDETA
jgi:Holliday junction resolvase RusA-like endonuclease